MMLAFTANKVERDISFITFFRLFFLQSYHLVQPLTLISEQSMFLHLETVIQSQIFVVQDSVSVWAPCNDDTSIKIVQDIFVTMIKIYLLHW